MNLQLKVLKYLVTEIFVTNEVLNNRHTYDINLLDVTVEVVSEINISNTKYLGYLWPGHITQMGEAYVC